MSEQVYQPVTITPYFRIDNDPAVTGASESTGPSIAAQQDGEFQNWELSGLFTVPTEANPLTMHIYVSSFIADTVTVQLLINKVINSNKMTIFQTAIPVPGMGAVEVALDANVFGLKGQTVEVLFKSPDPQQIFQLMPSVEIIEVFPADGSTLPLLLVPPENFQQVLPPTGDGSAASNSAARIQQQPVPPIMETTGIFDVPQGIFAVRPQVTVILSSFSEETLTADVVVNRLVRGTARKETVLTQTVEVPPGEERQFNIENVEGLPIEVNFTLSRDDKNNPLVPSVHVTNLFTADNTVQSVLIFPAGGLPGVFVESETLPVQARQDQVVDVFTTGGFLVPDATGPLIMHLYLSNPSFVDASITFRINLLSGDEKRTIFSGRAVVPAGGANVVELVPSALGLGGKKIEVDVVLPLLPDFNMISPSVSIIAVDEQGNTRPVISLPSGDFISAREEQIPSAQGVPSFPNAVSWGIFDVPVSPSGSETDVNLNFSNVQDQPETAILRVFALVEGTTRRTQILRQFVTVPANGAEILTLEGLDGMAIEVVIELPFAQSPFPVLPLLTPSVQILRTTDQAEIEHLFYLAPGELRFV